MSHKDNSRAPLVANIKIHEKVLSAEPTGCNSTWYIGFENENHSHAAMEHLKAEYNLKVCVMTPSLSL